MQLNSSSILQEHPGGEVCLRLGKRCLIKCMMKIKVTYQDITRVNTEKEGTLNKHPLRYTYDNEIEKFLTSANLYVGGVSLMDLMIRLMINQC